MNASSANHLDKAVKSHGPVKCYNYQLADSNYTENSNSMASKCDNIKRYTRAKLFDLRKDPYSRHHLEGILQAELQSLGIWKFHTGGNVYPNRLSPNSEAVSSSSGGSYSVQMSSTHLNLRSQRSPSRREQNTAANITNSSSQHNLYHHSLHKSYIDHRSISSSHLMPAFAKRRIAASSTTTGNTKGMVPQNLPGSGNSSYGPNSPVNSRPQTPTDVKDGMLYNSISTGSNGHMRQCTKDKYFEYRHSINTGSTNVGDDQNIFISPQRKVLAEHDRDRDQELQSNDGLSSPVSLDSSRHSHNSVGIAHERRIGSGRLLPRDVSWDYRTAQDRDKSQILNSVSTIDKETPLNHLGQTRGGRYSERTNDRTSGGGNGHIERRQFDRRGGGTDDNICDKYEHGISTNSPNAHSVVTRRDIYGPESLSSQHTASHNRSRRNHQYNERNEEPEWFSDGPTSQHDTIELRGFEEIDDNYNGDNSGNFGNNKRSAFSASLRKMSESSSSRASSTMNLSSSKAKEQLHGSVNQDKEANCILNMYPNSLPSSNNTEKVYSTNEEEGNTSFEDGDRNNNSSDITQSSGGCLPDFLFKKDGDIPKSSSNLRINTRGPEFNFDVFLNPNLDPLKHSLMRGDNSNGNDKEIMGSSRFSRWFGNKNGSTDTASSAGSNNDNSNATEPIQDRSVNKRETNTLMEFLNKLPALPDSSVPQKVTTITSVEELEARMRGMNSGNGTSADPPAASTEIPINKLTGRPSEVNLPIPSEQSNAGQPQAGEIEAFKKLLEQLGSGNKQHAQPKQNLLPTTLQMNVLIPHQNRTTPLPPLNIIKPGTVMASANTAQQMLINNDEFKKIIHPQVVFHQHNQNNGDMNNVSQPQLHTLSILFGNQSQKCAEARNLYQCLTRGEVSIHLLEQELNNPNAPPHAKEVIAAVLRETTTGAVSNSNFPQNHAIPGPIPGTTGTQTEHSPLQLCSENGTPISNRTVTNSPNEPLQHQLSQRIPSSNVTIPGQSERISLLPSLQPPLNHLVMPSQRELQFHTQTIMQNVILKKKLEAQQQQQQDSLRRRPEIQKQPQPIMFSGLNELDVPQKIMNQVQNSNSMQQAATQQHTHISHAMQQQHQQTRHVNSPTPLAFTPTSVLRKMTAEKDNANANTTTTHSTVNTVLQQQNKSLAQNSFINCHTTQQTQLPQTQSITTQPRMILGGTNFSQQHQQISVVNNQLPTQSIAQATQQQSMQSSRNTLTPVKWPLHLVNQNMAAIKPMGRPILKGPLPPQPSSQQQQMQQQISQQMFNKLDCQQMKLQLKNNQSHVLSQSTPPFPQHTIASQQAPSHSNVITLVQQQQQQQQLYQHQQRALALQRHQQQQLHLQQHLHKQQQQHQQLHQQQQSIDSPNRNMCLSSSLVGESNTKSNNAAAAAAVSIINYRDGGLSPTSNQLAQWFSPELLAQASAGKLPMLNMNQTLSLEEFEKNIQRSSTTVHN